MHSLLLALAALVSCARSTSFDLGLDCGGSGLYLFCDEGLPYGGVVCFNPPPGEGWVVNLVQCDAPEHCDKGATKFNQPFRPRAFHFLYG